MMVSCRRSKNEIKKKNQKLHCKKRDICLGPGNEMVDELSKKETTLIEDDIFANKNLVRKFINKEIQSRWSLQTENKYKNIYCDFDYMSMLVYNVYLRKIRWL